MTIEINPMNVARPNARLRGLKDTQGRYLVAVGHEDGLGQTRDDMPVAVIPFASENEAYAFVENYNESAVAFADRPLLFDFQTAMQIAVMGVFDQGGRAYSNGSCKYLVVDDATEARCHVGHWIPRELYRPSMDCGGSGLNAALRAIGIAPSGRWRDFASAFQSVHDGSTNWNEYKRRVDAFAGQHGLSTVFLADLTTPATDYATRQPLTSLVTSLPTFGGDAPEADAWEATDGPADPEPSDAEIDDRDDY